MNSGQTGQNLAYAEVMSTWQVQTAKQRFSEVLREAEAGVPQFITRHGKEVAVIIDIDDYRASHAPKRTFWEHLNAIPRIDDGEIDLMELIGPRQIEDLRDPFEDWTDEDFDNLRGRDA